MLEEAKKLLAEYQNHANVEDFIEIRFSHIVASVFQQELHYYLEQLGIIIKTAEQTEQPEIMLKQMFRQLCKDRWAVVKNTSLSYIANADSNTNHLFWQLSVMLFKPESLGQMASIIMPESTVIQLVFSLEDKHKKQSLNNVKITFEVEALETALNETLQSLERLKSMVAVDDKLFDLNTIANFKLSQHQKFFKAIYEFMPNLAQVIYTHNYDLSILSQDLQLMLSKGLCLGEKLSNIARQLRQGGQTLTGQADASLGAQRAAQELFDYINSLPNDLREQVVLLEASDNGRLSTLASIMTYLKHGDCVEQASDALTKVIKQKRNESILKETPLLSELDIKRIKEKYDLTRQSLDLNKNKDPAMEILPWQFLEPILRNICLESTEEYIIVLTSLPTEFYASFIKGIKSTRKTQEFYAEILRNNVLTSEQTSEFVKSLRDNERISMFEDHSEFYDLFDAMSESIRLCVITSLTEQLSRSIFSDIEKLTKVLSLVSKDNKHLVINKLGIDHLLTIIQTGDAIANILNNVTKEERLDLLKLLTSPLVEEKAKECDELIPIIEALRLSDRIDFIELLSKNYINNVINNGHQLNELIKHLPKFYLPRFFERISDCISGNLSSTYDMNYLFESDIKEYHFNLIAFVDDSVLEECKPYFKNKVQLKFFFENEILHRLYLKRLPQLNTPNNEETVRTWVLGCLDARAPQFAWNQTSIIPELYDKIRNLPEPSSIGNIVNILSEFINANKLARGKQSTAVLLHTCKELKLDVGYKKDDKTDQFYLATRANAATSQEALIPRAKRRFSLGQ